MGFPKRKATSILSGVFKKYVEDNGDGQMEGIRVSLDVETAASASANDFS